MLQKINNDFFGILKYLFLYYIDGCQFEIMMCLTFWWDVYVKNTFRDLQNCDERATHNSFQGTGIHDKMIFCHIAGTQTLFRPIGVWFIQWKA